MPRAAPSMKEMRAFKIGARARKFALEGCPIDGYEILFTAIAEAKESEPELYPLLKVELEKFERRIAAMDDEAEV